MAYKSQVWNFQCWFTFNLILRFFNLVILSNNVFTILVHFAKILSKCDIYKHFMWRQDLGVCFLLLYVQPQPHEFLSIFLKHEIWWWLPCTAKTHSVLHYYNKVLSIDGLFYCCVLYILQQEICRRNSNKTCIHRNKSSIILYINIK